MIYDYVENVKKDLIDYLTSEFTKEKILEAKTNDEIKNKIYDSCCLADCVTGNGSGSYTFSTFEAEENLNHNFDLLIEALDYYDTNLSDYITNKNFIGAESLDVSIRCYILNKYFNEILEEIQNSLLENLIDNIESDFENYVENKDNTLLNLDKTILNNINNLLENSTTYKNSIYAAEDTRQHIQEQNFVYYIAENVEILVKFELVEESNINDVNTMINPLVKIEKIEIL